MSTEDNKTFMRRFYEEVMNQKNLAAIDDFLAPTFVNHSALQLGMLGGGIEEVKQYVSMILTTFPDLHYTVEDMIAEGDKVVARLTVPLNVSAPFHSRYMREVENTFADFLKSFTFAPLKLAVIANYTAQPYRDAEIHDNLYGGSGFSRTITK